jgi:putative FmdB family regulatory protein
MPMYDFECVKCSSEFEEKVPLTEFDTKIVKCPKCGDPAKRKISGLRSVSSTWKNWRT